VGTTAGAEATTTTEVNGTRTNEVGSGEVVESVSPVLSVNVAAVGAIGSACWQPSSSLGSGCSSSSRSALYVPTAVCATAARATAGAIGVVALAAAIGAVALAAVDTSPFGTGTDMGGEGNRWVSISSNTFGGAEAWQHAVPQGTAWLHASTHSCGGALLVAVGATGGVEGDVVNSQRVGAISL
jgi:hypothetical protein